MGQKAAAMWITCPRNNMFEEKEPSKDSTVNVDPYCGDLALTVYVLLICQRIPLTVGV